MSTERNVAKPTGVFFSYSHRDERFRNELVKHLSILKRQGVIAEWHDHKITAGDESAGEIDVHLNSAQIILLLISPDFLASDYCYDVEVNRAMERHEAGEARVIPIILRPVDWRGAPFGKLQALPTDAKPVTRWSNRDAAFEDVARAIRVAVEAPKRPGSIITGALRRVEGISQPEAEPGKVDKPRPLGVSDIEVIGSIPVRRNVDEDTERDSRSRIGDYERPAVDNGQTLQPNLSRPQPKMQKKRVYLSFDYDHDRHYRDLLSAMITHSRSDIDLDDVIPDKLQRSEVGRVKAIRASKIRNATHTLVIVGEHANDYHPDSPKIGERNWQWWEIRKSKEEGKGLITVKTDRSNATPDPLLSTGATWADAFDLDSILRAIDEA